MIENKKYIFFIKSLSNLFLLFCVFLQINSAPPMFPSHNYFGGGPQIPGMMGGEDFGEITDPADALAMISKMSQAEQDEVFAQVQEMLAASGVEDVNMADVRRDIMSLSEELEDPENRKALNEKIYSDLEHMEKNFPEMYPGAKQPEPEMFVDSEEQPDFVDKLTENLESKNNEKTVFVGKKGLNFEPKKADWIEVLKLSESPLAANDKIVFRAGVSMFLTELKHVNFELDKLIFQVNFSQKKEISDLIKNVFDLGLNLASFSRSFHLKFLFDKAQKPNRELILNGILAFNELKDFFAKSKIEALLDSDSLNESIESILNPSKSKSKKLKVKLPAGLFKQIKKQLKILVESNKKGFGEKASEGLKKEIDKKKKLLKTTLAVASRYKKPVGGSSSPFGRGSSNYGNYSSPRSSRTGLSNYGKGGGDRGGFGRDNDFRGNSGSDSSSPSGDNSGGGSSVVKKSEKNESLEHLLESDLLKEINSVYGFLDNFTQDTVKRLAKLFMNEGLLDLKNRVENIIKKKYNYGSGGEADEDGLEEDSLSKPKTRAESSQVSPEDVKKKLAKVPKVLFYLSRLPREITIPSRDVFVKKEATLEDGEPDLTSAKKTTTSIPFFAEFSGSEKIKEYFEFLTKNLSAPIYKKYINLIQSESYKITDVRRKILETLSIQAFQAEQADEEKWSKNITSSWAGIEKAQTDLAINKINEIVKLVKNYSSDNTNIFKESSLSTKMFLAAGEVVKILVEFPLISGLGSNKEFSEAVAELLKLFVKFYQKLINACVAEFDEGNVENSFFLHETISSFEGLLSELKIDASEHIDSGSKIQIILKGLVLFNSLADENEKQLNLWKQKPTDTWQTLFSDLNFMLNFKQNKKELALSPSNRSLWNKTSAGFKALVPHYLRKFCQGETADTTSFEFYEKFSQLQHDENPKIKKFAEGILEKLHVLSINAGAALSGGGELIEFSFEAINLMLKYLEINFKQIESTESELVFPGLGDEAKKVLSGISYLLNYGGQQIESNNPLIWDKIQLSKIMTEDFIGSQIFQETGREQGSEAGSSDDFQDDAGGDIWFKQKWLKYFYKLTSMIDNKNTSAYINDSNNDAIQELARLEKICLLEYFGRIVQGAETKISHYFLEAIDQSGADGQEEEEVFSEASDDAAEVNSQAAAAPLARSSRGGSAKGGLLNWIANKVNGMTGWAKSFFSSEEHVVDEAGQDILQNVGEGDERVEDQEAPADDGDVTSEVGSGASVNPRIIINNEKISVLRCLLAMHQPKFKLGFSDEQIDQAWKIALAFEALKYCFLNEIVAKVFSLKFLPEEKEKLIDSGLKDVNDFAGFHFAKLLEAWRVGIETFKNKKAARENDEQDYELIGLCDLNIQSINDILQILGSCQEHQLEGQFERHAPAAPSVSRSDAKVNEEQLSRLPARQTTAPGAPPEEPVRVEEDTRSMHSAQPE